MSSLCDPYVYTSWKAFLNDCTLQVDCMQYEKVVMVRLKHNNVRECAFGAQFVDDYDLYSMKERAINAGRLIAERVYETCKDNIGDFNNG